jgi:glycosyltransferase involved in cell wall biosynthesis
MGCPAISQELKMKNIVDFGEAQVLGEMDPDIAVCVIVNTYNHSKFIAQCLDSILDQKTDFKIKIVVHDDFSKDGTREILNLYFKSHPEKFILILENSNQWNLGISNLASLIPWIGSKYIALCEGDDFWTDNSKLQRQRDILEIQNDVSLVYHSIEIQSDVANSNYGATLEYLNSPHDQHKIGVANFISTCSVMFRNGVVDSNVFMGIRNLVPVDWILCAALADSGRVFFIPKLMATYRIHSTSLWSSNVQEWRMAKTEDAHWYLAGLLRGEIGSEARKVLSGRSGRKRYWRFPVNLIIKMRNILINLYDHLGKGG